jgi:RNA 2',3'-cyclic 3'-phosphodiesterase
MVSAVDRSQGRTVAVGGSLFSMTNSDENNVPPPPHSNQEHYRLFIAIRLPDTIKAELVAVQAELQARLPDRCLSWTKPEQLHLTLKFLGNVAAERIDTLEERLAIAVRELPAFVLRAEQVGAFPDTRYPRVIWAGLTDVQGALMRLQSIVESTTSSFVEQTSDKSFSPHTTLARVKHIKAAHRQILIELLSQMNRRCFGEWTVHEIELMRSQLFSAGALHSCLASFQLTRT